MELDREIEALLFWRGTPMTKRELSRVFGVNLVAINDALMLLQKKLEGRGVVLVVTEREVSLTTAPSAHKLIEQFQKEELGAELGRAALETLSVVLYKNGATRRELEYVRGVNSTSILRTLLMRGLVSRENDPTDERVFRYRPTIELLALLGLKKSDELPDYAAVSSELTVFEKEATPPIVSSSPPE